MADKENLPPKKAVGSGSKPERPPHATPIPESDDSILDFDAVASVREGASGVIPLAELPDPNSSPSLVSWTEVIRQHRETAQIGHEAPAESVKIDSVSDKDLLKRIVADEQTRGSVPRAFAPSERDTDKLKTVPMLNDGNAATDSSIQLEAELNSWMPQPASGSAVRFEVTNPPSDAGGVMPNPWPTEEILEALPVDESEIVGQEVFMAEWIANDFESLPFATEVEEHFGTQHDDEDITESPLDAVPLGEHSSILDILIRQDRLDEPGIGRAASDVVDFGAGPTPGIVSFSDSDSHRDAANFKDAPASGILSGIHDLPKTAPSTFPGSRSDESNFPHGIKKQTMPSVDLSKEDSEEAVDLYAEGPLSHGISDSGRLQLNEKELAEAARRQKAIESSAIDLSSHSDAGSVFDMNVPSSQTIERTASGDDAIDMSLPPMTETESAILRRVQAMSRDDEEAMLEDLQGRRVKPKTPTPPKTVNLDEPQRFPRQSRKISAAAAFPAESDQIEANDEPDAPPPSRRTRRSETTVSGKKRGGLLVGALLGIVVGAAAFGGAWYAGALPADPKSLFGGAAENKGGDKGNGPDAATQAALVKAQADKKDANDRAAKLTDDLEREKKQTEFASKKLNGEIENQKIGYEAKLADANDRVKAGNEAVKIIADKLKLKPDEKPGDAIDAVLKARKDAEVGKKAADEMLAAIGKSLKDAGIDDPKIEDGLKKLVTEKTSGDSKIKAIADALDKAGIKEPDLAKALAMLVAARDDGDSVVKAVRGKLEAAKIVEPNATRVALFKALDDAIVRGSADAIQKLAAEKKVANAEAASLAKDLDFAKKEAVNQRSAYEAKLAEVRTPAQVVDVWLPALSDKDKPANTTAAIVDAELVLKNPASKDADKAKALAVKALALRNSGKVAESRVVFGQARKHPGFAKDQPWGKEVANAAEVLSNPAEFVGVNDKPTSPPTTQQQLAAVENGLKLFPADTSAKDHARLLAQRALLKLEMNDVAGAGADADAAIKIGAGIDGAFAQGRVFEKQGKWVEAEKAYRDVLAIRADHKRAQLGLARVLLQRAAKIVPAATSKNDDPVRDLMLLFTVLLAAPEAASQDVLEAIKLADALIAQKEYLGHIIKADALAKLRRYNDALHEYSTGLKALKVLPKEYDGVLDRILALHPSLQKPDASLTRDASLALKHYSEGLEHFRAGRYAEGERNLIQAIRYNDSDARYIYFLGLSRWMQNKKETAAEDFKAGAVLEMQSKPTIKAVNESLETIQGPVRQALDRYRP